MLKEKDIRPVSPITIYSVSDLYKAFRLVETGRYLGEVIVQPHQGELVKLSPFKRLDPVLQLIGFPGSPPNRGNKTPHHRLHLKSLLVASEDLGDLLVNG